MQPEEGNHDRPGISGTEPGHDAPGGEDAAGETHKAGEDQKRSTGRQIQITRLRQAARRNKNKPRDPAGQAPGEAVTNIAEKATPPTAEPTTEEPTAPHEKSPMQGRSKNPETGFYESGDAAEFRKMLHNLPPTAQAKMIYTARWSLSPSPSPSPSPSLLPPRPDAVFPGSTGE